MKKLIKNLCEVDSKCNNMIVNNKKNIKRRDSQSLNKTISFEMLIHLELMGIYLHCIN